mgnify:CR=1 FL=1
MFLRDSFAKELRLSFFKGITNFAQEALGDVVFVELPKVGRSCKTHESVAAVESVKAVAEVYIPLAGTITAVNNKLRLEFFNFFLFFFSNS